jgi:hypothetical protein
MSDIAPVYVLLAVLPVVAFWKHGSRSALRAISIVVLAHLGPLAGLFMGAALYGQARSHNYLGWLHFALFIISIAAVVMATKPLRPFIPQWAFTLFFAGVAIMNLFAYFVGGMALADDWV